MAYDPAYNGKPHALWALLIVGLIAATLVPIGIHTVMLDNLGIPYPAAFPHTGWATLPDHALRIFALFYLDAALRANDRFRAIPRVLIVFLAVAALNEDLLRLPIMRNAVSTRWTIYPFIDNLPQVLRDAILAIAVAVIGSVAEKALARAAAALSIALCMDFTVMPWLGKVFVTVIAADAKREGDQLYIPPYDWHVDLPSYLTYAEPAIAAMLLAWLLAKGGRSSLFVASLLFGLRSGPLFGVLLNVFYAPSNPALAILSKGQFAFETAALALIAAGVMTRVQALSVQQFSYRQ